MLVVFNFGDDVVGNEIIALTKVLVEGNVLDGKVEEVCGIVDSEGNDRGVVISKDS